MELHTPYDQIRNRPCDFIVKYRFYTVEEGGRKTGPPMQGYRSDFMYDDKIYMIHPEFLNENGNVILDKSIRLWTGKAKMWMLFDELRGYHKNRIKVGTKGFFMEGLHKTAECEVIEIIGLNI